MNIARKILPLIPVTLLVACLIWLGIADASTHTADKAAPEEELSLLYRFTGVSDDGQQGSTTRREATSIHCTNLERGDTIVEARLYQWNGTDVYTGTVTMPSRRTFTFSTQNTTIYFDDALLGGSPGTGAIFQGNGQIWASNDNVICTAQILDPLNYPPTFVTNLPLYRMIIGIGLTGPGAGWVGEDYTFTATIQPSRATTPIAYTWQATGLPPVTQEGGTVETVVFNWTTPGTKTVTVTASNPGSSVSQSVIIDVSPRTTYLPFV
jgi:hypothetical protein